MKIYISHKKDSNFENELYEPLRNSELVKKHNFIFPHEDIAVTFNVKEMLQNKECDLVIAEVSYPATGQGIELAWANMFDIPVVCIYKEGVEISGSLSFITNKFLMYTSKENMLEDIEGAIKLYE